MRKRSAVWLGNLAALVLGLMVAVAIGEVGLRLLSPPPLQHVVYPRNTDGFRDREHDLEAPPNTVRIAFIGDSFTYGVGVDEVDQRFGEIAAARLSSLWEPTEVEPFNFGLPGANTQREIRFLTSNALPYRPNIGVLSFVLNDPATPAMTRAFQRAEMDGRNANNAHFGWLKRAADYSAIAGRLHRYLYDTTSGARQAHLDYLASLYAPGATRDAELEALEHMLEQLDRLPLGVVVLMPSFLDHEAELDFYQYARGLLRDKAAAHHLLFLEVLPVLAERPYYDWWVHPSDHHPNADAHVLIGQAIAATIAMETGPDWKRYAHDKRELRRAQRTANAIH
jgi:hypothetical protein